MVFPLGLIRKLFLSSKKTKKRVLSRRKSIKRSRKPVHNGAIAIKRVVQYDKDYVSCGAIEAGNYTFELTDMPDYAAFSNLYEYFRIDKVKVDFRAMNNQASFNGNGATGNFTSMGRIHTVIDYNSANNYNNTRAGVQDMMKDNSYKCTTANRSHSRTFVPKILLEAGGASVGAVSRAKQWIPTGATTAALTHYCLKWLLEGGDGIATNISYVIEPTVTMWVSFKDIKSQ